FGPTGTEFYDAVLSSHMQARKEIITSQAWSPQTPHAQAVIKAQAKADSAIAQPLSKNCAPIQTPANAPTTRPHQKWIQKSCRRNWSSCFFMNLIISTKVD